MAFSPVLIQLQCVSAALTLEMARTQDNPQTPAPKKDRVKGSDRNTPGAAATDGKGLKIPESVAKTLADKMKQHNEQHGSDASKKATVAMLKKVYQRGVGAYSTSHRPSVTSREQWGLGRVNAFLKLLHSGKPDNDRYVADNDLLPNGHPKASKK